MNAGGQPLENHPVYEFVRTIGRGQRSFVQVARNRLTGELVACKFIPRGWEPSHTKYVAREILNHQELSLSKHPHVVEFKEVFLTNRYLAEVLEYVEGETLQVFLEKVGGKVIEGLARFIFQQLIIALDFCHRKGKVNRDIKLSNILLSIAEGQLPLVKLCDFGFSKDTYRHSEPHSQVGTALFVAPEVMQNFSGGRYDGQAADVWACGVCLFIMLFGRHPYLRPEDSKLNEQQQMIKLFQRMMQNQVEFPPELASTLTPECLDLLGRMLRTNPSERYTMADIQRHVWFSTALPEGAGLMNDLFLAEDAASLSPQSQSQIESLVALAAKLDDLPLTRVQLPSAARAMAAGMPPVHPGGAASASAGGMMQHQQHQLPQQPPRPAMSAGGVPSGAAQQHQQMQMQQQRMQAGSPSLSAGMVPAGVGVGIMPAVPANSVHSGGQGGATTSMSAGGVTSHMQQQQQQQLLQQRGSVGPTTSVGTPPNVGSPVPFPTSSAQAYSSGAGGPDGMQSQQQQQPAYSGGGNSGSVAGYGMASQQQQQAQSGYSMGPGPQDMQGQQGAGMQGPGQGQHHHHSGGMMHPSHHGVPQQQQQGGQFYAQQGNSQHHHHPQQGGSPVPATVNAVLNMIPDLDAMIMSMPETDLLQAATIDLRPYQQQQQGGPQGPGYPGGLDGSGGSAGAMGPPPHRQMSHHSRPFANSISSCAPGSVIMPGGGGGLAFTPSTLDPTTSSFLGMASGIMGTGPSGVGAGLAPLLPPGQQQQPTQQQQSGGPAGVGVGPMPALPQAQGPGQQGMVDVAPFLYEGNDDDLPMVGSVSAVVPNMDWGSFNATMLGNNAELVASQVFNASRFTRVCRDVTAKLASETGRSTTPPGASPGGGGALSPEELALQQQMSAMGVGLAGRGPSMSAMHGSNGPSRLGLSQQQ